MNHEPVRTEKDSAGRAVLSVDGTRGLEHLHADSVFIRASDGVVMICLDRSTMQTSLTGEQKNMIYTLPLVKKLLTFSIK